MKNSFIFAINNFYVHKWKIAKKALVNCVGKYPSSLLITKCVLSRSLCRTAKRPWLCWMHLAHLQVKPGVQHPRDRQHLASKLPDCLLNFVIAWKTKAAGQDHGLKMHDVHYTSAFAAYKTYQYSQWFANATTSYIYEAQRKVKSNNIQRDSVTKSCPILVISFCLPSINSVSGLLLPVSIGQECVGYKAGQYAVAKNKNLFPLPEIKP